MIRSTVHRIGGQLARLAEQDVPINRAFDILSGKARSIEEIVAVEVMREVYREIVVEPALHRAYADSSTRSARMPSMALSR